MKLKVGDTVLVRSGRDRGKSGKVVMVLPALNKVVIDGINTVKRAHKPSAKQPKGGIIEQPQPMPAAKVGVIHPSDPKRSSRVGYVLGKDGKKQRVYKQAESRVIKEL